MAAILDQAWLQGKIEKSEPKILFCLPKALAKTKTGTSKIL
jgi:hypothetical protein